MEPRTRKRRDADLDAAAWVRMVQDAEYNLTVARERGESPERIKQLRSLVRSFKRHAKNGDPFPVVD
jgi:hypothetical protein